MKKIKEIQKRSSLNEGRNYGIGFAILKPVNSTKTKFETLNAFTACRDYLNDFSYVEYTKKEIGKIHGYNHKLLNIFNRKRLFYLGVNTLNFNNNGIWADKKQAQKLLINNYKFLQTFLNRIETQLNLKTQTEITVDEDVLIFKAPLYWTKTTALISAYTLLIRCFFNITEEQLHLPMDVLFEEHKCFIEADQYMKQHCTKFYQNIGKLKFDKINYSKFKILNTNASSVHNFGIAGFLNKQQI